MLTQLWGNLQKAIPGTKQDHATMSGPKEGREFSLLAPAGYYIALRVGFAFPVAERNALPEAWVEFYTLRGFMLYDPIVRWSYENEGSIRWSALQRSDPRQVLQKAANFGLKYGAAIACAPKGAEGQRSYGAFARSDREFEDEEIDILQSKLRRLHEATAPPTNLTDAELEALSMVRDGLLLKEIANRLGVSEGAIKQRLKNAKSKLNAKTSSQAVSVAVRFGLI